MLNDLCDMCVNFMDTGLWYMVHDNNLVVIIVYRCVKCNYIDTEFIELVIPWIVSQEDNCK
jgi:hypothetical protein